MPKSNKPKEKIRLSLDFPRDYKEKLLKLEKASDATTSIEVIRRAVSLYELFIENKNKGGKLIIEDSEGTRTYLTVL